MNTRPCFCLYLRRWGWLAVLGLLLGCAPTQPMALSAQDDKVEVGEDAILLLRIHTINRFKPDYQPAVLAIHIIDRATGAPMAFQPRAMFRGKNEGYEYLATLRLHPGAYEIASLSGMSFGYRIRARFEVPLHREMTVGSNKVLYLGRIEARNVARTRQDQPPAGPELPLHDQSVSGFKQGTFDVEFGDFFREDLRAFRKMFPALRGVGVESLLPQG